MVDQSGRIRDLRYGPAVIWPFAAAMACGEHEAGAYQSALASGACESLAAGELRNRCWTEHGQCAAVTDEKMRFECAFRHAEVSANPADCSAAGPFADDCRMHVWSDSFGRWSPNPPVVGNNEEIVQKAIEESGFSSDDPRPWSAWYRHALSRQGTLDRGACRQIALPLAQEACLATGLSLYGDRLNAARDRGLYPCDGGELPDFLQTTPDAEIDSLRASRQDLCP